MKPAKAPLPFAPSVESLQVDELGDIEKTLAPHRALIAREEALRKAIRARFDASDATSEFETIGARFVVEIGPKALQRAICYPKLIKALGLKKFAEFATWTLGNLEAHVACGVVADVVSSANTGSRSLKVLERGGA